MVKHTSGVALLIRGSAPYCWTIIYRMSEYIRCIITLTECDLDAVQDSGIAVFLWYKFGILLQLNMHHLRCYAARNVLQPLSSVDPQMHEPVPSSFHHVCVFYQGRTSCKCAYNKCEVRFKILGSNVATV